MKTTLVKCSQCGIEFQKSVSYIKQGEQRKYSNHFCSNNCSTIFNRNLQKTYKKERIENYYKNPKICLQCNSIIPYEKKRTNTSYCSSKCSAIYTQKDGGHCHWTDEDKKKLSNLAKSNPKWVENYNKKDKISKICPSCGSTFEVTKCTIKKLCCSRKCSNRWIKSSGYYKNKGRGGFRPNSGTSKKGWYKGYFCGSSWELAWLIYQLDHNIQVQRNKQGFTYVFNGKNKKYYPDFIVNGEYIEIKNYITNQVIEKTKQFPYKLKLLYKSDLKDIFEYVEQKYGKNFIRLYENKS